jgi:hypothetical protein
MIAIAMFSVWALHAKATNANRDMVVASAWAEQRMEEQLAKGYTAATEPTVGIFKVVHIVEDNPIEVVYRHRVYVTDNPDPANPGLKSVRVEVAWEHGGQWRKVHLVTRLSWQG